MKIAVACGGTGGHIYPGLATGHRLRDRGHEVTLWLGGRDVEALSARTWDGPVERVCIAARRPGLLGALRAVIGNLRALRACRQRMKVDPPDIVLGMGGYASAPPVLAGRSLGATTVLHESNAVAGLATRFLGRFAHGIGLGFDAARSDLAGATTRVVGFPLREGFADPSEAALIRLREQIGFDAERLTLFAMGGSQGAAFLNTMLPEALAKVSAKRPVQIIHVTGADRDAEVRAAYAAAGVRAHVLPYVDDIHLHYQLADLAVCRAGAATCAELAAMGLQAVLVPYPHALRDEQSANARAMEAEGRAQLWPQSTFDTEAFVAHVIGFDAAAVRPEAASVDAADALCDFAEELDRLRRTGRRS